MIENKTQRKLTDRIVDFVLDLDDKHPALVTFVFLTAILGTMVIAAFLAAALTGPSGEYYECFDSAQVRYIENGGLPSESEGYAKIVCKGL